MISAQTPFAFVARENRLALLRIMLLGATAANIVGEAPTLSGSKIRRLVDPATNVACRAIPGNCDKAHVDLVENLRSSDGSLLIE
jgi:hypothetical protein